MRRHEPTISDHQEIDNQEQSPINDDFINDDELEQLESSCEEGLERVQYLDSNGNEYYMFNKFTYDMLF